MRYFIVAVETNSDSPYYMETGWVYYHDPSKFAETETTIGVDNELHHADFHPDAPKELLLEISKDDYNALHKISELGYDSSDLQDQVIKCRKEDGSNKKPYAIT